MATVTVPVRCLCEGDVFAPLFTYTAPPGGETRFPLRTVYRREIVSCERCGHLMSVHEMDLEELYAGPYVTSTYGDDGIRRAFERILALDPSKSDNVGRVARLVAFAETWWLPSPTPSGPRTILDVGSGLCVFLHRMKGMGWRCTALDPDPRAVTHARERVGVAAVCGDFLTVEAFGQFDVVTFNKVLEHVRDPVAMLVNAQAHVAPGGFVYLEVPDGEMARRDGPGREEFFIDHWHVFSAASVVLLARRAGFVVRLLERLQEPSSKYTLRAFLVPAQERTAARRGS